MITIGLNSMFAFAFLLENQQARDTLEPVLKQVNSKLLFEIDLISNTLGTTRGLYSSFVDRIPKYTEAKVIQE